MGKKAYRGVVTRHETQLVELLRKPSIMAKVLDVYYEGLCQRVKFYPATLKNEVLELILKMFTIFPTEKAKLEEIKHQSIFLDEDGDPVVFVPDVLPSGTRLTLRLQPVWQGTFSHHQKLPGTGILM